MRGAKKEITCKCGCGRKKLVRIADLNRGWGKFYSKNCKAKYQVINSGYNYYAHDIRCDDELGWDEHKEII